MNKIYKTLRNLAMLALPLTFGAVMTSCESGDQDFPDYGTTTVYFANQSYVRTIELGEDPEVDLTNDNNHEFSLNVAMGGGYGNKHDITVNFTVDASSSKARPSTMVPTWCSSLRTTISSKATR